MNNQVQDIFIDLVLDKRGIYCSNTEDSLQDIEKRLREKVANIDYHDYFKEISKHHSIPVMDYEVERFVKCIPKNGIILDVGGCWGWHWRNLYKMRPDLSVIIVDFIYANLKHAKKILNKQHNHSIYLICADATNLPIKDQSIDGYWSVQAIQHMPNYENAINEADRVLKKDGLFINYSLNSQACVKWLYKVLNKTYSDEGHIEGLYYLIRGSDFFAKKIADLTHQKIRSRYSELLFHPPLKLNRSGRERSLLGWMDSYLSGNFILYKLFARQRSFEFKKII